MGLLRRLPLVVSLLVGCSASASTPTSAGPDPDASADLGADDAVGDLGDDAYFVTPKACTRASDCAASEVCAYPIGNCTTSGTCVTPHAVEAGAPSVRYCGCDGSAVEGAAGYPDGLSPIRIRGAGVCPGVSVDGGAAPSCTRGPESGCPTTPCPAGTVCADEIGGVAGGGGSWCAPIPADCAATPTCACMGLCACGSFAGWAERCADASHGAVTVLACDDGIR